jgi:CYTH domain-containing protein
MPGLPPELEARAAELGFVKPKYAWVERERRWLCSRLPEERVVRREAITDLYIEGSRLRLREARPLEGGEPIRRLTKKGDLSPERRVITTIYLSEAEFALFQDLPGRVLRKTRHYLPGSTPEHAVAVDRFDAYEGLLLAEVEFASDAAMQAYPAPEFALREVTHEARYTGGQLALGPPL